MSATAGTRTLRRIALGALLFASTTVPTGLCAPGGAVRASGHLFPKKTVLYLKAVGPSPMRWSTTQPTHAGLPRDPGIRLYDPVSPIGIASEMPAPPGRENTADPGPGSPPQEDPGDRNVDALLTLLDPVGPEATPADPLEFAPPTPDLPKSRAEFRQR